METTEKEIERVRFIHRQLDNAAEWYRQHSTDQDGLHVREPGIDAVTHTYTAAEVREWPEIKRRMFEFLGRRTDAQCCNPFMSGIASADLPAAPGSNAAEHIARGLCLYRSMLPASPAQEAWVPRKGDSVRVKSATASPGVCHDCITAPLIAAELAKPPVNCSKCHAPYKPAASEYANEKLCGYCAVNSHESLLLAVDNRPALRYWKEPSPERRARLSRFDPTPWQDWPKGWDDEP